VPLRFVEKPSTNVRNIHLSAEEWKIIPYINSRNTVRQIADFMRLDEHKMRRLVFGLQSAGWSRWAPPRRPCPARRG